MTKELRVSAIREAVTAAGGAAQLAEMIGVTHQAVYYWLNKGYVPPARAVVIEALFKIDRNRIMNPELLRALNTPVADFL